MKGGLGEEDALNQVRDLAMLSYEGEDGCRRKSVDMIEVSGGDYETPGAYDYCSRD